jgi:hypothetical protein
MRHKDIPHAISPRSAAAVVAVAGAAVAAAALLLLLQSLQHRSSDSHAWAVLLSQTSPAPLQAQTNMLQ